MDSINKNQTEHNHEDLNGTAAVEKIKHIVDKVVGKRLDDSIQGKVRV